LNNKRNPPRRIPFVIQIRVYRGGGTVAFFEKKLRKKLQQNKDSEKAKTNALG